MTECPEHGATCPRYPESRPMPPSAILTAAADRLRDLAAAATPGAWSATDLGALNPQHDGVWWVEATHADDGGSSQVVVVDLDVHNAAADARWIAALSPAVAGPLQSMLRFAALAYRMGNPGTQDETALALARVLVGEGMTGG